MSEVVTKSKIAAIGAGAWGKNIVKTLHELNCLVAVAEASDLLRNKLAVDYPSLEIVADYESLAARTDIDAITIATPAPTHHQIAKFFLKAGKDVFVEKPMTMTSEQAEDLIATAQQNQRILMVGHLLLYKPAVQFIREYLAAGHLGRIFTLHQERAKLGKARAVENALWSLGVHDVAALLYIIGQAPQEVTFSGHKGLQSNIEDDSYLHMTFANGIKAHLHNSWLWPEDRRGLFVVGEKGMLSYDEKQETLTLIRKTIDSQLNNVDQGAEVLFTAPADFQALQAELSHFLDCVSTRQSPLSNGQNGLDVVRVLEKAAQ
jgi:predicted dehydrogenase